MMKELEVVTFRDCTGFEVIGSFYLLKFEGPSHSESNQTPFLYGQLEAVFVGRDLDSLLHPFHSPQLSLDLTQPPPYVTSILALEALIFFFEFVTLGKS